MKHAAKKYLLYKIIVSISSQRDSIAGYCYVVPSSPILSTLMMEAMRSSETLVLIRSPTASHPRRWHSHSHRRENLNSSTLYILIIDMSLRPIHLSRFRTTDGDMQQVSGRGSGAVVFPAPCSLYFHLL
jgi:hypothetical protein